jgi:aspartyl-tRNA(Asn)/glutamyl-tRNA(Gln) amidotransferase subunit C
MSLNRSDIEKIAKLARMALDEAQVENYARELSNILTLVKQLEQADTADIEPMFHPLHMTQRLRPDEVTETDHRQENQAVAPQVRSGHYLVPKVIE